MSEIQQKFDDIAEVIRKEIEEVNAELTKPAGLMPERRVKLIDRLRMLHWFMELLTEKDRPAVPLKDDKLTKKVIDKMTPTKDITPRPYPQDFPRYPDGFNPFDPKPKPKRIPDPRPFDPIDDWTYDPFRYRKNPFDRRRKRNGIGDFRMQSQSRPPSDSYGMQMDSSLARHIGRYYHPYRDQQSSDWKY